MGGSDLAQPIITMTILDYRCERRAVSWVLPRLHTNAVGRSALSQSFRAVPDFELFELNGPAATRSATFRRRLPPPNLPRGQGAARRSSLSRSPHPYAGPVISNHHRQDDNYDRGA